MKEKARGTREIMAAVEGKMRSAHGNCMLRVDIRHYSVAVDINSSVLGGCLAGSLGRMLDARQLPCTTLKLSFLQALIGEMNRG